MHDLRGHEMSKAVAFLAGLGAGYMDSQRKKKDDERQAARDARDTEVYEEGKADRAAARAERDQGIADKNALRTAGAALPVTEVAGAPMPAEAANPGAVASNNPTVGAYRVGANTFANKGVAATDAAAQSTPDARRTRVMQVMQEQGNFAGADQLRTSGIQAEAAAGALAEQKDVTAQKAFARGVASAIGQGGWQGFAKFATEKYNDDKTYSAVEDGKGGAIVVSHDKDGKEVGRKAFTNPEEAIMFSVGRADPTKWAEYKAGRDDKKEAQAAQTRGLDIHQQNADTNEQFRKDQVKNQRDQMAMTERHQKAVLAGKAQTGGAITLDIKTMRDFEGDMAGYLKEQFPVKDGAEPKDRAAMNAEMTSVKALGNSLFRTNAQVGIPLTAGTVMQAMELAKDRKNVRIVEVGGNAHEAVIVHGQPVITTGPLQRKAAPAPAANTPAAVAKSAGTVPPKTVPSVPVPAPPVVNPSSAAAMAARAQLQVSPGWK